MRYVQLAACSGKSARPSSESALLSAKKVPTPAIEILIGGERILGDTPSHQLC